MSSIFFCSSRKSKNQKNRTSGAPGPACASPWRAKRMTLSKLSTFSSQLSGGPFEEISNFRKKSHNAEKLKGGTLWRFSTSILSQNIKKWKGGNFYFRKVKVKFSSYVWGVSVWCSENSYYTACPGRVNILTLYPNVTVSEDTKLKAFIQNDTKIEGSFVDVCS